MRKVWKCLLKEAKKEYFWFLIILFGFNVLTVPLGALLVKELKGYIPSVTGGLILGGFLFCLFIFVVLLRVLAKGQKV